MSQGEVGTKILKTLLGSENIDDTITIPAAAKAANDISLAAIIRYVSDEQLGEEWDGDPDIYDALVTGFTAAVTAVVQGSILERLEFLQDVGVSGNAIYTATATTTTTVTCAALPDGADYFEGQMLLPITDEMVGQGRYITAYDGDDILTVTPPWAVDPSDTMKFVIVPSEASIVYEALTGAAGILAWPGPAVPAANVSIAEVLEYILQAIGASFDGSPDLYTQLGPFETYTTLAKVSLLAWLGLPNTASYHSFYEYIVAGADTSANPNVAADADGSVMERQEYIQDVVDAIKLQGEFTNVVSVTADFTSATWNTEATHELFTVTGAVRLRVLPVCTGTVTESVGGDPTICLGVEGDTDFLIADTIGTLILQDILWLTATPADFYLDSDMKVMVTNDNDIGYEIKVGALDGGSIVFYCLWTPIETGATVVAGAGGVL